ncbi:MAG TPA: hypothetical protein VFV12_08765 [Xanthobacteraceae bacterium]|nr:hypothetical protein [Xanthobacteraceae bacterium]
MVASLNIPLPSGEKSYIEPRLGKPTQVFWQYLTALDSFAKQILAQVNGLPSPSQVLGINLQTASYTLVLADAGFVIEMNLAGANTLTIPPNSAVAFPVKTFITAVQVGAGQTTLTAGAGVTLRTRVGLKITAQWGVARLYQRAANEWVCSGDLSP